LWGGVSEPYKHTIRAFLAYFNSQMLRHSTLRFRFQNGSVGNFFFAGARVFFGSLDAAIFLYSRVSRIPDQCRVLPAISTNDHLMLAAELEDGTMIHGQSAISHPTDPDACTVVNKHDMQPMSAPVRRIMYLSSQGAHREHEIFPSGNKEVLAAIAETSAVVYGCGSLYTSICPSLILSGMGEQIAQIQRPKILLLNGSVDRETAGMDATAVVRAVTAALNRTHSARSGSSLNHAPSTYITAVLAPKGGGIPINMQELHEMGIFVITVESTLTTSGEVRFEPQMLVEAMKAMVRAYRPLKVL